MDRLLDANLPAHLRDVVPDRDVPEAYWQILSDALIHRIHERVFEHIKREVELGAGI